jgi:hypothetical protein
LLLDLGHLRTLIMTSDSEALTLVMMIFGLALTYGTAATAGAIMLLSSHDEGAGGMRPNLLVSRVAARKNHSARRADYDPRFCLPWRFASPSSKEKRRKCAAFRFARRSPRKTPIR